jgi:hypothetical protein
MVSSIKNLIMKKLTPIILATCFMLSVIPTQIKAATGTEVSKTTTISSEKVSGTDQINEIKPIELNALNTSENKEVLKDANSLLNDQGRHNGRYQNRRNRDVDVTIQGDRGYRHNHSGAYIGGGGVLVLILILILVL